MIELKLNLNQNPYYFQLDISDEFRRSIESLRGHDDKIRIVLNKADMVDHQQLMRVSIDYNSS